MNTHEHLLASVEAILFSSGDPVELKKIAQALDVSTEDVKMLVEELMTKYETAESALTILLLNDDCQMVARSEYADIIRSVLQIQRNTPLSSAAFEVLAVIAYNEPVTRSFIEQVRGVDSSAVVATLTQRGLIQERGRLDLPGRPLLYGTTPHFLRCFSLSSLEDLPKLPPREDVDDITNLEQDNNVPDLEKEIEKDVAN